MSKGFGTDGIILRQMSVKNNENECGMKKMSFLPAIESKIIILAADCF